MEKADSVFINGKVVTADKDFSFKKAIAVKDGWIIDVGENSDIKPYIGSGTRIMDLKGKVILPGAHDAHSHGVVFGANHLCCDCSFPKVKTIGDLQAMLAEKARELPPGKWIRGNGINSDNIEECRNHPGRGLSRRDLDAVTPDHPVILVLWSGHGVLVNTRALEICGIQPTTKDPESGVIERDEHGVPTGVFLESSAINLISQHVPLWTDEELRSFILEYQRILNEQGYTSYTESTLGPGGNERDSGASGERNIHIYKQLYDEGLLTARVSIGVYTGCQGIQSYESMLHDLDTMKLPKDMDPNWLKISMLKIFCDGVHLGHTAWMMEDYYDQPGYHGRSMFPGDTDEEQEEELHKMIMLAHQRGYQVAVHAIGDRSVKAVIDGYIKAKQAYPSRNLRHYVIHADSFATNEMAQKAARYKIPFSVQPGLADYLFEPSLDCVGPRASRMFGLREFLQYGVVLAGGSDSLNGEYCNWRKALQSAVTRRSAITGRVHSPELAISVEEGIRLFTCNGAYQENCEQVRGSIEIGKVADFQVLDQDIFQVDPEEISSVGVEMTMAGGKVVYCRNSQIEL